MRESAGRGAEQVIALSGSDSIYAAYVNNGDIRGVCQSLFLVFLGMRQGGGKARAEHGRER